MSKVFCKRSGSEEETAQAADGRLATEQDNWQKARRLYERLFGPPELVPDGRGGYRRNPAALARRRAQSEAPRQVEAFAVGVRYEQGDPVTISSFKNGRAVVRAGVTL